MDTKSVSMSGGVLKSGVGSGLFQRIDGLWEILGRAVDDNPYVLTS